MTWGEVFFCFTASHYSLPKCSNQIQLLCHFRTEFIDMITYIFVLLSLVLLLLL